MTVETISTQIAATYAERVAAKVRGVAAEKRVTGVMLAHRLGISPMSMSRRMTGHHPFGIDELAAVALALGVPVSDLLPPLPDDGAMPATARYPDSDEQPTLPGLDAFIPFPRQGVWATAA